MCGIVGYIGNADGVPFVLDGLKRLEYRGYDSAGISTVARGSLHAVKSLGKLSALETRLSQTPIDGALAIGHTRWATHGVPSEANSHPHFDESLALAVVHNGIIENYLELGAALRESGIAFRSETDTETIAHLIRRHLNGNLTDAVRAALHEVRGAYALGVVSAEQPDTLVAARLGSPLIVGIGDNAHYIASDATPLLKHTRKVMYLEDGDVATLTPGTVTVTDIEGRMVEREIHTVDWDDAMAEKAGYPHFMAKEIHEQPEVVEAVCRGRIGNDGTDTELPEAKLDGDTIRSCPRIIIVACGTAWHAGLVGKRLIESLARIPVDVEVASEFRYKELLLPEGAWVIPVSQSGETADTLEAVRIARKSGARILGLVNVPGSTLARESNGIVSLRAGIEIGVASTKAYTAMITAFVLLAVRLGRERGALDAQDARDLLTALQQIPQQMRAILEREPEVKVLAARPEYRDAASALFLGRGYNLPTAFEGALKLKETSYIHAEGCGAGEMKHGPIALVTDVLPVICIAPQSATREKVLSNIQEIRARDGIVLAVATEGDTVVAKHARDVLPIPACPEALSPLLAVVPLQLFAYHVSVNRGCDVDQPRNLAKSVTVE